MPPKRKSARQEQPDLAEAFLDLSSKIAQQAREPNILAYKPHAKQLVFHKGTDHLRAYIGGNRSGKTFGATVEDVWWASGTHPYRETPPPPLRGRVVAVDLMQGVNHIILPLISRHVTPSMLINGSWEDSYSKSERVLTFSNGSFIEFMSYEMEIEKFAGTSRHFTHYDEEPPKGIFQECQARLIDTNGSSWISMTPVEGITWVHEDIYEPVNEAADKEILMPGTELTGPVYRSESLETLIVEVAMNENPHLSEKARERYLRTLDEETRAARSRGEFVQIGGKIFPYFSDIHIIDPVDNPAQAFKGWEWYSSVDHGWNNPTAWLWHAVSPEGIVVTFAEHYKDKTTIEDHAAIVKAKEAAWGREPTMRTGDPAMKQTSAVTGTSIIQEYQDNGLFINVETVPRQVEVGIAKMQQYFKIREDGKPRWFITRDCENFIREMRKLRWKTYTSKKTRDENNKLEQVHKKDDHTFDSARYFSTFLPDLSPDSLPSVGESVNPVEALNYDQALLKLVEDQQNVENTLAWTTLETYD